MLQRLFVHVKMHKPTRKFTSCTWANENLTKSKKCRKWEKEKQREEIKR